MQNKWSANIWKSTQGYCYQAQYYACISPPETEKMKFCHCLLQCQWNNTEGCGKHNLYQTKTKVLVLWIFLGGMKLKKMFDMLCNTNFRSSRPRMSNCEESSNTKWYMNTYLTGKGPP